LRTGAAENRRTNCASAPAWVCECDTGAGKSNWPKECHQAGRHDSIHHPARGYTAISATIINISSQPQPQQNAKKK